MLRSFKAGHFQAQTFIPLFGEEAQEITRQIVRGGGSRHGRKVTVAEEEEYRLRASIHELADLRRRNMPEVEAPTPAPAPAPAAKEKQAEVTATGKSKEVAEYAAKSSRAQEMIEERLQEQESQQRALLAALFDEFF